MNYVPLKKKAFLRISGTKSDPNKKHLYCILNDVIDYKHFVVPICTVRTELNDNACLLQPGDHPFLTHLSYVAYNHIDECHTTTIIKCIRLKEFQEMEDFESAVFSRICQGVVTSNRTPLKALKAHHYCSKD